MYPSEPDRGGPVAGVGRGKLRQESGNAEGLPAFGGGKGTVVTQE